MKDKLITYRIIASFLFLSYISSAYALTFSLPPKGDIIGRWHYVLAKKNDSLTSIGQAWQVGYCEMKKANPDIKSKKIKPGTRILIPTKYILPEGPRKGIVVNLAEHRLYYYFSKSGQKKVMTFPVAIGRPNWRTPELDTHITQREKNPQWIVPESIKNSALKRGKVLPDIVKAGPRNPLGQRKMRVGNTSILIHGTNTPTSVGKSESSGCLRMLNAHVKALYKEAPKGTPVRIINTPYKVGVNEKGTLYVETHTPIMISHANTYNTMEKLKSLIDKKAPAAKTTRIDNHRLLTVNTKKTGIPKRISVIGQK